MDTPTEDGKKTLVKKRKKFELYRIGSIPIVQPDQLLQTLERHSAPLENWSNLLVQQVEQHPNYNQMLGQVLKIMKQNAIFKSSASGSGGESTSNGGNEQTYASTVFERMKKDILSNGQLVSAVKSCVKDTLHPSDSEKQAIKASNVNEFMTVPEYLNLHVKKMVDVLQLKLDEEVKEVTGHKTLAQLLLDKLFEDESSSAAAKLDNNSVDLNDSPASPTTLFFKRSLENIDRNNLQQLEKQILDSLHQADEIMPPAERESLFNTLFTRPMKRRSENPPLLIPQTSFDIQLDETDDNFDGDDEYEEVDPTLILTPSKPKTNSHSDSITSPSSAANEEGADADCSTPKPSGRLSKPTSDGKKRKPPKRITTDKLVEFKLLEINDRIQFRTAKKTAEGVINEKGELVWINPLTNQPENFQYLSRFCNKIDLVIAPTVQRPQHNGWDKTFLILGPDQKHRCEGREEVNFREIRDKALTLLNDQGCGEGRRKRKSAKRNPSASGASPSDKKPLPDDDEYTESSEEEIVNDQATTPAPAPTTPTTTATSPVTPKRQRKASEIAQDNDELERMKKKARIEQEQAV